MKRLFIFLLLIFSNKLIYSSDSLIVLKNDMVNISTSNVLKVYYDRSSALTFSDIKSKIETPIFKNYNVENVPGKFERGLYTNWYFFKLSNPNPDTFYLLLEGNISKDSFWLLKENDVVQHGELCTYPVVEDKNNIIFHKLIGIDIVKIPPSENYNMLIKNYDSSYGKDNSPKLFDAYKYEVYKYDKNKVIIFLFEGCFILQLVLFIFFGFQAIFNNDETIMWYSFFALVSAFITFRNLESINPHFFWSLNYITWDKSKLFHSVLVFYIYSRFLLSFLEYKPAALLKIIKLITAYSIIAIIIEVLIFIVFQNKYYRYLNYFGLRIILTFLV